MTEERRIRRVYLEGCDQPQREPVEQKPLEESVRDMASPEKQRSVINPSRGRPFGKGQPGNPAGRPLGARNRATLAAQALLDGQLEAITQKAAEQALQGDINAIRLCLQHGLPPRREQPIEFELKRLESIHDVIDAIADVISAVSVGKITVGEGIAIVGLIEAYGRACRGSQDWSQSEIRALDVEEDREDARRLSAGGMP